MPTLRLSNSSPDGIIARLHCPDQNGEIDLGRYCTEEYARDEIATISHPNEKSMSCQVYTSGNKEVCCSLSLFHLLRSKRNKAGADDFEYTAKVFIDTLYDGKVRLSSKEIKDCEYYIITPIRSLKGKKGTFDVWIEEKRKLPSKYEESCTTMTYKFSYVYFLNPAHHKMQVDNAKSHPLYHRVPSMAWKLWERESPDCHFATPPRRINEVEDDNDGINTPPLPSRVDKGCLDDVILSASIDPSERGTGREILHGSEAVLPPAKQVIQVGRAELLPTLDYNVDDTSIHSLHDPVQLDFCHEKSIEVPDLLPKEECNDDQSALDIAKEHNPLNEGFLPCKKISAVDIKKRPREEEALFARQIFKGYHSRRLDFEDDCWISKANQEKWKMKIAEESSRRGHQVELQLEQQYNDLISSPYLPIRSTMQELPLQIDDTASRSAITPWGRGSRNAARQQPRISEVSLQAGPDFAPYPPGGNLQSSSTLQAPYQRQSHYTLPPAKMRHYRQWRK